MADAESEDGVEHRCCNRAAGDRHCAIVANAKFKPHVRREWSGRSRYGAGPANHDCR